MTTGTRLKKKPKKWVAVIFSTTLWFSGGLIVGWYQGNAGGFRRGVTMTSQMVMEILKTKDADADISTRKYSDI